MEQMLQVGILSSTHGVRGEMKVFPTTDDAARFKKLKSVLLDTGSGLKEMQIEGVKFFKQFVILKFKDHDSINDIERYKGHSIYVTRENAVRLKKDEYFIADLIDMKVVEEDGNELGILSDVLETGANDVYVVELKNGKEGLFPAIPDCIKNVDVENKRLTVHVMKGLLD